MLDPENVFSGAFLIVHLNLEVLIAIEVHPIIELISALIITFVVPKYLVAPPGHLHLFLDFLTKNLLSVIGQEM